MIGLLTASVAVKRATHEIGNPRKQEPAEVPVQRSMLCFWCRVVSRSAGRGNCRDSRKAPSEPEEDLVRWPGPIGENGGVRPVGGRI